MCQLPFWGLGEESVIFYFYFELPRWLIFTPWVCSPERRFGWFLWVYLTLAVCNVTQHAALRIRNYLPALRKHKYLYQGGGRDFWGMGNPRPDSKKKFKNKTYNLTAEEGKTISNRDDQRPVKGETVNPCILLSLI